MSSVVDDVMHPLFGIFAWHCCSWDYLIARPLIPRKSQEKAGDDDNDNIKNTRTRVVKDDDNKHNERQSDDLDKHNDDVHDDCDGGNVMMVTTNLY